MKFSDKNIYTKSSNPNGYYWSNLGYTGTVDNSSIAIICSGNIELKEDDYFHRDNQTLNIRLLLEK